MTLDKATREAIAASVRRATIEIQEVYQEQWLTGEQLCEQIPLFTKEWLHRYGQTLPRECVRVTTTDGVMHKTSWCYPKMKILRMLAEGEFRGLQMHKVEKKSKGRLRPATWRNGRVVEVMEVVVEG